MRELADAAGVRFAMPFNQFACKAAIVLALSARRIATMRELRRLQSRRRRARANPAGRGRRGVNLLVENSEQMERDDRNNRNSQEPEGQVSQHIQSSYPMRRDHENRAGMLLSR
jgi:hypothetical protein